MKANVTTNMKLIEDLRQMFRKAKGSEKVTSRAQRVIADETVDYDQMYADLFENVSKLSKAENASQKHLLSVIYSRGLYSDDKTRKKNLIIPRNYYFDVEIRNPRTKSDQNNFDVTTGVMMIHKYKGWWASTGLDKTPRSRYWGVFAPPNPPPSISYSI